MNSTSTSNLQTKPKITTLGADDATPKTITLEMVFWVENNSKFVRGKSRSLKDIEYWVFNDYDIQVTDKECGRYEITLCYTSYKSLDEQLDTIEMEASRIADSRHGFIEFDVFTIASVSPCSICVT